MVLKQFVKNNKANLLFFSILILIFFFYNYHHILFSRPYSVHQWRQADCLSITMNYYQENRNFFEPAIHWVGEKDGKTVSECPIIYYSVAKLWKIFGYHEFIFRLINLLLVFLGLFCLFKLILDIISDIFWSLAITFLLFSSPILVFYSNNFMADAPALGLALTGLYLFWIGYTRRKKNWYYLSYLFFLLAGLIKISSLLAFIAILIIHVYTVIFIKKEKWWFFRWYSIVPYAVVLFIIYLWYNYAMAYNEDNLSGIFLTGLFPIWDLDWKSINEIWNSFSNDLLPAYLNINAIYVVLALFILSFVYFKKFNKVLFFLSALIFIGCICYFLFFFRAFSVHDYYLTNLLIFIPFPIITILEMLRRNYQKLFINSLIKIFVSIALIMLIYETVVITRMKYSTDDWLVKNNFVTGNATFDMWYSNHHNHFVKFKTYESITPYLRSLGINRNDRVFCISDESINITLYLMDQKGFTSFGYWDLPVEQRMEIYKKYGVKYIIGDTADIYKQEQFKPFLNYKIGNYKNVVLYELK